MTQLAILLCPVLVATAQVQEQHKFRASSVIQKFTGQNGFEEMLVACERADQPNLKRLRTIATEAAANLNGTAESSEAAANRRAAGIPEGATLLQIRQIVVDQHRECLQLLRKGAEKPTYDPRADTMDFDTLFPDFSLMKSLARVALMAATVDTAYGRPKQSLDHIMLAMTLGDSLRKTAMIGQLVSNAIRQLAFNEIEMRQASFGLNEWQRVEEWSTQRTASYTDLSDSLRSECAALQRDFDKNQTAKEFIKVAYSGFFDDVSEMPDFVKNLPEATAASIRRNVRRLFTDRASLWIDLVQGDEANWLSKMPSESVWEGPELGKVRTVSELEAAIARQSQPMVKSFVEAHARLRTQIRVLGLYAKVQRYRLQHDKLPQSLADVASEDERNDPHSGSPFVYELREDGTFRLYSKGFRGTGEIEFRYRRPKGQPDDQYEPPSRLE